MCLARSGRPRQEPPIGFARTLLDGLRRWTLPGGAIAGATALWVALPEPPLLEHVLEGYPYAVYAAGMLLAWRLRRSRLAAALLAVVGVALAAEFLGPARRGAAIDVAGGAALPVAWAGLALLRDRPLVSRRGARSLALVILATGLGTAAALRWPAAAPALLDRGLPAGPLPWAPTPAIVTLAAGVVVLITVAARRRGPVERALIWSFFCVEVAVALGPEGPRGGAFLLAGGLVLAVAAVESSFVLAYHDELTALPARRALGDALERTGRTYTIAMVDIDHFKSFNDRHGHEVGDQVLRMVAARLRRESGPGRAFRYGGEEFTLLYPGLDREGAAPHLEAVRRAIEEARFVLRGPDRGRKGPEARRSDGNGGGGSAERETLSVTVSIGAAGPRDPGEDPWQVLERADRALYRAKENGRNRVAT